MNTCIDMNMYTHIYTHVYVHTYTYVYIYVYMDIYTEIHLHLYAYIYIYIHIHVHTYLYIYSQFEPFYPFLLGAIKLAGGVPTVVRMKPPHFAINAVDVEAVISTKTRMLVHNSVSLDVSAPLAMPGVSILHTPSARVFSFLSFSTDTYTHHQQTQKATQPYRTGEHRRRDGVAGADMYQAQPVGALGRSV